MSEDLKDKRLRLIVAAEKGVDELIKVLETKKITNDESDVTSDKMKNAASAKKLAFMDAIEMLEKISSEKDKMEDAEKNKGIAAPSGRFVENRSKPNGRG